MRTLPSEENFENESESPVQLLRRRLLYVKGTFLSAQSNQRNSSDGVVPKEKLCELWVKNKKKAIEIIKNSGVLPSKIQPVINKEKTEEYFSGKYENIQSTVHANILENCEDVNSSEVELFRTEEIKEVLDTCPNDSACGKDGVYYKDLKAKWHKIADEVRDVFNITLINKRVVRGWKHGLIKRAPKKNYSELDFSSFRDISLLSCVYKLFMKCLLKRITPRLTENVIGFWQRAYLKKRDRQELIFCVKTAIEDFKHMSSKFYGLFINFRDAFGSLDQSHMIKNLAACGIEETYCKIVLDIYQDSHFEVICDEGKEFALKTGRKSVIFSVSNVIIRASLKRT